jgi:hypothetical protein
MDMRHNSGMGLPAGAGQPLGLIYQPKIPFIPICDAINDTGDVIGI